MPELLTTPPPNNSDGGQALVDWTAAARARSRVQWDETSGTAQLFGYAETLRLLRDHDTFSNDMSSLVDISDGRPNLLEGNLAATDPPYHRKLRKLISDAFTARAVREMEPRIAAMTNDLLDAVEDSDQIDLVSALFYPLPASVIADLLGVPATDHKRFHGWADSLLSIDSNTEDVEQMLVPDAMADTLTEMREYMGALIRQRRSDPQDDLISRLLAAEVDGERLTENELFSIPAVLLLAGHISTTLILGSTITCLHADPAAMAAVRADHAAIPGAVEEALRFRPPATATYRLAKREVQLGDVAISPGTMVMAWTVSANRDELQFDDPDTFDITRRPNPHLGFGHGVHFCIGAPLARLEAKVVLGALFDRYSTLDVVHAEHHAVTNILGVRSLVAAVTRA